MSRSIDDLGLDGIGLSSNVGGRYLGDPSFAPILAEAARRRVPVFVHPASGPSTASQTLGRPSFLVEFPMDTARGIVDLIYSGAFDRHPDLRVIAAHCGGVLTALAWRISHLAPLASAGGDVERTPEAITRALGRLYLDTALSGSPPLIGGAIDLVGTGHLLYGTDCGAASDEIIGANDRGLTEALPEVADLDAVEYTNAEELFARLGP